MRIALLLLALGCSDPFPDLKDSFGNLLVSLDEGSQSQPSYALGSRFELLHMNRSGIVTSSDASVISVMVSEDPRDVLAEAIAEGTTEIRFETGSRSEATMVMVRRVDEARFAEATLLARGHVGRIPLSFFSATNRTYVREQLSATSDAIVSTFTPRRGDDQIWVRSDVDATVRVGVDNGEGIDDFELLISVVEPDVVATLELEVPESDPRTVRAIARDSENVRIAGLDLQWTFDGTTIRKPEDTPGDQFTRVGEEGRLCVRFRDLNDCITTVGSSGLVE